MEYGNWPIYAMILINLGDLIVFNMRICQHTADRILWWKYGTCASSWCTLMHPWCTSASLVHSCISSTLMHPADCIGIAPLVHWWCTPVTWLHPWCTLAPLVSLLHPWCTCAPLVHSCTSGALMHPWCIQTFFEPDCHVTASSSTSSSHPLNSIVWNFRICNGELQDNSFPGFEFVVDYLSK